MPDSKIQIITFYRFKKLVNLPEIRRSLIEAMRENSILGTIIIAEEGFNSTICGEPGNIEKVIGRLELIFETKLNFKSSVHEKNPFKRIFVKIKPEIVSLKQRVEIERGGGTHVSPQKWNEIIRSDEVFILDARNNYEHLAGTFSGAVNSKTTKFSELPKFVEENLHPEKHKKVALFCTGGIRCEKFAPFLKAKGFEEVFQLEGGILKYLEETPETESLWRGECFVFDERIALDQNLQKGKAEDLSPKPAKKSKNV